MRSTKAIINLSALQHNLGLVRQFAPSCKVMAVVKADAYGHGIVQVANNLQSADAIAVACMDEALLLRQAGIATPIILLEGIFDYAELDLAVQHDLQIVLHQAQQLEFIEKYSLSNAINPGLLVWLKLDTGMNRLGFDQDSFIDAYWRLKKLPLVKTIQLMSHLACADDIGSAMNSLQIRRFNKATQGLSGQKSMANSAGSIAWPESHFDWIRPGIALYGVSPLPFHHGAQHQLVPAMTLQSQLFAIKTLQPGDTVGYGAAWRASRKTRIGVIAIGYGDGYPRHAKEGTPVWIKGKTYPLVGKVSMDMLTVDLGLDAPFEIGDPAILWGKELPVEIIAEHANTIPYTLLCGVTSRVRFEWVDSGLNG